MLNTAQKHTIFRKMEKTREKLEGKAKGSFVAKPRRTKDHAKKMHTAPKGHPRSGAKLHLRQQNKKAIYLAVIKIKSKSLCKKTTPGHGIQCFFAQACGLPKDYLHIF